MSTGSVKSETSSLNVYSKERNVVIKKIENVIISDAIKTNGPNIMDGLTFLDGIFSNSISVCFFDPQYRGIMDKMKYGNEGVSRQIERSQLSQMSEEVISEFIQEIGRVLIPSGHLFLWVDKFHLCQGVSSWLKDTDLSIVDLITLDNGKIGMGYRTRRKTEYLVVIQKLPIKAKGIWTKHNIPDVWTEKIVGKIHPHQKPLELQKALIEAVTNEGEYVIDPCAGSYNVMEACKQINRIFIGSDLRNPYQENGTN